MPGYDGSGPFGDGRPGRGLGPCGRFRSYFGYGRNRGYNDYPPMRRRRSFFDFIRPIFGGYDDYEEGNDLKNRKKELEQELDWVNNQLKGKGTEK